MTTRVDAGRVVVFPVSAALLDAAVVEQEVADPELSAYCTFIGTVRDSNHGKPTTYLFYSAYTVMAERELARIGAEAVERWPKARVGLAHRSGRLSGFQPPSSWHGCYLCRPLLWLDRRKRPTRVRR